MGGIWTIYPPLVYEWLYPELLGQGALIWVEQGGWLLLSRAILTIMPIGHSMSWGLLWWVTMPMHLWSLVALSHLGYGGMVWHTLQLLMILWLSIVYRRLN